MTWSWEVAAEKGFSDDDDICRFLDIATNAIERHGKDDCHNVAGEIRDDLRGNGVFVYAARI